MLSGLHFVSEDFDLVIDFVLAIHPLRWIRPSMFILVRLSESLKRRRGVGSITPGLSSKVLAQFLFYRFELGSIHCASDCEDLIFQPNGWSTVL